MREGPVRTYRIAVSGYPSGLWNARSPGKARAQAWRAYSEMTDCTFRRFLGISRCEVVPNPPGVGDRILVAGEPATRVISENQYVRFMRDGSDQILCSHPADVSALSSSESPDA